MKNKKGFTLVELISVIILLSIIITIAVLSFTTIKRSILKSQYKSLVSSIEVAAKKYASETGAKTVFVQTLIDEGYIEADDENKNLYNPLVTQGEDEETDTKILNCYVVRIEDDKASFDESASHGSTGNCDATILNDTITLKYCIGSICNKTLNGTWENDSIKLRIESATLDLTKATSYTWISPLSPGIYENGTEYEVVAPSSGMINDDYEVKVVVEGKEYTSKGRVKIDKQAPYVSEISYTPTAWSVNKTIKAKATDLESGLVGYAITTSNTEVPSTWISINGEPNVYDISDTSTVKSNVPYYVWVKDKAGNTNKDAIESTIIDIQTIDNIPPECKIIKENENWTKSNVTVIWGGIDKETLCKYIAIPPTSTKVTYNNKSQAISTTTKEYSIPNYRVYDEAGNYVDCTNMKAKAYVDKTKPTVDTFKITSNNSSYNSIYTTVTITGSDAHSGPAYACINTSNTTSGCVWNEMTNGSYTGSYTIPGAYEGAGTSKTYYAFVMDGADKASQAGNISTAKKNSYTLYSSCSSTTIDTSRGNYGYGDWSTCSKNCNTGIKTRTEYKKDLYLGNTCTSTTGRQNCNEMKCCSKTVIDNNNSGWGSCSKKCGGGTKDYTTYYKSYYDSTISCGSDVTDWDYCNTQDCCLKTSIDYNKSGWQGCDKECGGGTNYYRTYYKSYYDSSISCDYENTSSKPCNTQSCCSSVTYSGCGAWGSCNTKCGDGTKKRYCSYSYSDYNDQSCGGGYQYDDCTGYDCQVEEIDCFLGVCYMGNDKYRLYSYNCEFKGGPYKYVTGNPVTGGVTWTTPNASQTGASNTFKFFNGKPHYKCNSQVWCPMGYC